MADDKTQIKIDLKADDFIDSLDKSAAKAEDFGKRASDAMEKLGKTTDSMSKYQKRAYDSLVASYKKNSEAIKDMEAEYEKLREKRKSGQAMTEQELARLKELSSEYKNFSREMANTAKTMEQMVSRNKSVKNSMEGTAKSTSSLGDIAKIALGNWMAKALEKATELALELAKEIVSLGLKMQQTVSQLDAMKNNTLGGAKAYEYFNNVLRNTNWQEDTVMNMGKKLINLGYDAQQASKMIQILADTSAGLGTGEAGANTLLTTLNKLKSTSQFTAKDLKLLQQEGLHCEEAFAKAFGVTTQEALAKIKEGAVDGQQAFEILTEYMENEFSGSFAMDKSKKNITDAWGDIYGNITTVLGEIGNAIADGFSNTGALEKLILLTNDFVDGTREAIAVIRNDFGPAFEWIGNISGYVMTNIITKIKLIIGVFKVAYNVLQPFINALMEMYRLLNKVADAVGDLWSKLGKEWDKAVASNGDSNYYDGDYGLDMGIDDSVSSYKGDGNYKFNSAGKESSKGTASSKSADTSQKDAQKALERNLTSIRQKYSDINAVLKETRKGEDDLTKANNEYTNNALKGLELIKAQNEQKMAQLQTQKEREDADHKSRLSMLEELQAKLQAAKDTGLLDGSDKRLEDISKQMEQENALHTVRMANLDALMTKTNEVNQQRIQKEQESTNAVKGFYQGLAKEFSTSMSKCILNAESFGDAFADIVKKIIQQLLEALIYAMLLSAFGGAGVGGFGNFGKNFNTALFGKADGGLILGAGTGTSDSIPTMLSNGEYVINAQATKHNLPLLNAINSGYNPVAHFASGGLVGNSSGTASSGSTVTLNVSTIDSSGFSDFLSRGGLDSIKQALFEDNRIFASNSGVW